MRIEARNPVDQRTACFYTACAQRGQVGFALLGDHFGRDVAFGHRHHRRVEAVFAYALDAVAQQDHFGLVGEQGGDPFDTAARHADQQDRRLGPVATIAGNLGSRSFRRQRFEFRQHAGQARLRITEVPDCFGRLAGTIMQLAGQVLANANHVLAGLAQVDRRQQFARTGIVAMAHARAHPDQGQVRVRCGHPDRGFGQLLGDFEFSIAFAGADQFDVGFDVLRIAVAQVLPVGRRIGMAAIGLVDARARRPPAVLFGESGDALAEQGHHFLAAAELADRPEQRLEAVLVIELEGQGALVGLDRFLVFLLHARGIAQAEFSQKLEATRAAQRPIVRFGLGGPLVVDQQLAERVVRMRQPGLEAQGVAEGLFGECVHAALGETAAEGEGDAGIVRRQVRCTRQVLQGVLVVAAVEGQ